MYKAKNKINLIRTKSFFDSTFSEDNSYSSAMNFKMYDEEKEVGSCAVSIHRDMVSVRGEEQLYPDTWFKDKTSEELLPILEVDGYSTIGSQGKGYGRMGYHEIYELSIKTGCGGRIITRPTFAAGNFYDKIGMQTPRYLYAKLIEEKKVYDDIRSQYIKQGLEKEKIDDIMFGIDDGKYAGFVLETDNSLKYFDPIPENLAKLYKGHEDKIKHPNDPELLTEGAKYKNIKQKSYDSPAQFFNKETVQFETDNDVKTFENGKDDNISFTDEEVNKIFFNPRTGKFENINNKVENVKSRMSCKSEINETDKNGEKQTPKKTLDSNQLKQVINQRKGYNK